MTENFSPSLQLLAQVIGGLLGGPPSAAIIGESLVSLARRHQVGAMLHGAVMIGHHAISAENFAALESDYMFSVERRRQAVARLESMGQTFAAAAIDWMSVKGTTQAAQLYADPAWRFSADLDILVAERDFADALRALEGAGYVASYPPLPRHAVLRWLILLALRDVTLIARDDHRCAVELHRRLFFARTLRLPRGADRMPVAEPGPDLAFYLIAHGAVSHWARLKWLVDLVPLLTRLDDDGRLGILSAAKAAKAELTLAASLLLLRALFPFAALGPLEPWLDGQSDRPAIRRRLQRYAQALDDRVGEGRPSPMNDAFAALEANLMLFDSAPARARLLLKAPLASLARRLAAAFYPEQRSLTLPPS